MNRKNDFIERFIKFIQTMQQDNVYIGCEYGTFATDNMLMLNYFFNPKTKQTQHYINQFNKICVEDLLKLVENLTPDNKKLYVGVRILKK